MKQFFFQTLIILSLAACSTGRLNVSSTPGESEVFVRASGSKKAESIGKTPINQDVSTISDLAGGADTVIIDVKKNGFLSKSVVVTDINSQSDIKLEIDLPSVESFVNGTDPNMAETQRRILAELNEKRNLETNYLIDQLFEAQRLAQVGRTDDSLRKLDELEARFPEVAGIHEIRGGIAFMKKDYEKALDAFRKAARSNPKNVEVLNIKNFLEKKLGLTSRQPAENFQ